MSKRIRWIVAAGIAVVGVVGGAGTVLASNAADDDAQLSGESRATRRSPPPGPTSARAR